MPDLRSLLERESRSVDAPTDFERLVRRRDRRRRNRRLGSVMVALAVSTLALIGLVRAFEGEHGRVPADTPPSGAAGCPAGSTPDEAGSPDQTRPSSDVYMPMAFDRQSGRIVLLRARVDAAPSTWTFDVCTNTWQRMSPAREPVGGRAWGPIVYDADSDLTITILDGGSVWAYDVESDTWTEKGQAPVNNDGYSTVRMAYDSVSGLVWVRWQQPTDRWGLWTYDVDTDTWVDAPQENTPFLSLPADHQFLVFDTSIDGLVGFAADHEPWTFDQRTGRWSQMSAATPYFNTGYFASGGEAAFDETAERTVVFSGTLVAAYDARADRWTILADGLTWQRGEPVSPTGHWMVYDPLNRRLVVFGGGIRDEVWAFEVESTQWIQLVSPTES